jgi:hypothetical protein
MPCSTAGEFRAEGGPQALRLDVWVLLMLLFEKARLKLLYFFCQVYYRTVRRRE